MKKKVKLKKEINYSEFMEFMMAKTRDKLSKIGKWFWLHKVHLTVVT